ncbi:hypothetical protein WDW86_07595 [Bdellovibrionota bacterium FG-2]
MKKFKSPYKRAVTLGLSTAIWALGCGPVAGPQSTVPTPNQPSIKQSSTDPVPSPSPIALIPVNLMDPNATDISSIPADALAALLGTFGGTLVKTPEGGTSTKQAYTIKIEKDQPAAPGSQYPTYLKLTFESNGPIGAVSFSSRLTMGFNGMPVNFNQSYSFTTLAQEFPVISEYKFLVQLIMSVKNGKEFDPTQSQIFIKDCGFSQGLVCTNTATEVGFDKDLGKR